MDASLSVIVCFDAFVHGRREALHALLPGLVILASLLGESWGLSINQCGESVDRLFLALSAFFARWLASIGWNAARTPAMLSGTSFMIFVVGSIQISRRKGLLLEGLEVVPVEIDILSGHARCVHHLISLV